MGYIFLPKFTQTGQQRYATVKLSLTILRVKRQQHTVGAEERGSTETGLRFVRLGGLGNLGREWAARITPSLTAAVRARKLPVVAFCSHYRCI